MKRLFNHEPYKYDDDTLKQVHRGVLGAITGSSAAAYYSVPDKIARRALEYLPEEMVEVLKEFASVVSNNKNK